MTEKHRVSQSNTEERAAVRYIEVDNLFAGQRIDNYLIRLLTGVPKSHVYRLLRTGQVRVNKGRIKPTYKLKIDDMIRIPPVHVDTKGPVRVPDDMLKRIKSAVFYEDENYLALNKPPGLAVHAGSGLLFGLIDGLRQLYGNVALELVHRLDRGTSGCILVAKTRKSLLAAQNCFRDGDVTKTYLALSEGVWRESHYTVNKPLRKNIERGGERLVVIDDAGKHAVSHFHVLQQFSSSALIEVGIETGRTHQIRVHCASLGHPLIGDDRYGTSKVNQNYRSRGLHRMYLHAYKLELGGSINLKLSCSPDKLWDQAETLLRSDDTRR